MEGMVSMSLDKNSMLGMFKKVWLISGNEETMVMPDIMPRVASSNSAVWSVLFGVCVMKV